VRDLAPQIELRERVPDDDVAIPRRIVERLRETRDLPRRDVFSDGADRKVAQRHGDGNLTKRSERVN
jgi:hypothetical protein